MRNIIRKFITYRFYGNLVIFVALLAGLFSLKNMQTSFFPDTEDRFINVSVAYPGASPKEMDEGIAMRILESLRSVTGIYETNATSQENSVSVQIESSGEKDINSLLMDVKNAVDGIPSFPTGAERPIVFKVESVSPAVRMSVRGDVDLLTLKRYADEIESDLLNSGKISKVAVQGLPAEEISIEIKEDQLERYQLTFNDVANAVRSNNLDVAAGELKSTQEEMLIRVRERSVEPTEIGEIVLRANPRGGVIKVSDVATIKRTFADVSSKTWVNGRPALLFVVSKLASQDLYEISEFCKDYAKEFNEKYKGVEITFTFDYTDMLQSRLDILINNGLIGLLLVVVVLTIFLSFKVSLWVAFGIPFSFLLMFVAAYLCNVSIDMISLFGMIIVIGILVDDGIVVSENIFTHYEQGKSPSRAALDGSLEVAPAVFTSIITTIIAFSPLFFAEKSMEFLSAIAFVVTFVLLASLVEAFLVLPSHIGTKHVLKKSKKDTFTARYRNFLNKRIYYVRDVLYARLIKLLIRYHYISIAIPIAIFLISLGLIRGGIIPFTFFPSIPFDGFDVEVAYTPGIGEKKTIATLHYFDSIINQSNRELSDSFNLETDFIKFTTISFGSAFSGQENGSHAGRVTVVLKNMEGAPISSFDVAAYVRKRIGTVPSAQKFSVGGLNRFGSPIAVGLLGSDLETLSSAAQFMRSELMKIDELKDVNIKDPVGKQEIKITLKPLAYMLGMTHQYITQQIRQGFFGDLVQRIQEGRNELKIWVRYPREDRQNITQLENIKIKTPAGRYPLAELVDFNIVRSPVVISRYNGQRQILIEADLKDAYMPVGPISARVTEEIYPKVRGQFPSVKIIEQGQARRSQESTGQLGILFPLALTIIVLILVFHFRSVAQALIIIAILPFAFMGVIWGHGIEGHPISILSIWGVVALAGVIINDSVVFIDKYNSLLREGIEVKEAVFRAGISRFRAIVLTSITTVAGLYPLILETSFQAQFLIPMAISLAYGVLVGTTFILIILPSLILIVNDVNRTFKYLWSGEKVSRESVERAVADIQQEHNMREEHINE